MAKISSLVVIIGLLLQGCSYFGVYKIDIQQGNVVTQDMIDQLWPGMTKSQARYVMGTPLIQDTFHKNRWDYLYSLQSAKGESRLEQIALVFTDNQLIGLSGDFHPTDYTPVTKDDELKTDEETPESSVIDWEF